MGYEMKNAVAADSGRVEQKGRRSIPPKGPRGIFNEKPGGGDFGRSRGHLSQCAKLKGYLASCMTCNPTESKGGGRGGK